MKRTVLLFGTFILVLLLLFQTSNYLLNTNKLKQDIVLTSVAVIFFIIGIYLQRGNPKKIEIASHSINFKKIESLHLSMREYEVLNSVALGLSNKEIGEQLFVSESTIKSHVSNLLIKLNAKRRTHAVQIAKELQII